jgi:hypothetical protein
LVALVVRHDDDDVGRGGSLGRDKGHRRKTAGKGNKEEAFHFHFRGFGVINPKGLREQSFGVKMMMAIRNPH